MPPFAVVIVNYRSANLVSLCLDAIDPAAERVVVDNASADGSAELLRARHADVRIVERHRNDGFAAGVNAGFAATRAPIVVLLNPDCVPRPDALELLCGRLQASPATGVVAPRLVHADGSPQPCAYRRFPGLGLLALELCLPLGHVAQRFPRLDPYRADLRRLPDGARVAHATGAALAIRRTAYDAAGPFDEGYFLYLEETDWQQRVHAAGYAIEVVPSAEVVHLVRGGGPEALAPSPQFLTSMRRYLAARGRPRWAIEAAITSALALSRLAARAECVAVRPERRTGGARAAAYDALWRARRG